MARSQHDNEALAALSRLADSLDAPDEAAREAAASGLLKGLERWKADEKAYGAILDRLVGDHPQSERVAAFAGAARQARKLILDKAHAKVLGSLTHTYQSDGAAARCPKCRSGQVIKGEGWYEFQMMTCGACGHEELADDWQIGDWYRTDGPA